MKHTPGIVFMVLLAVAGIAYWCLNGAFYVVKTDSMEPTIAAGDVILTSPFTGSASVGDIITFEWDNMLVTHRVFEVLPAGLRTKGDNNDIPDQWVVPLAAVKRLYRYRIRYLGYAVSFLRTREGWFLCVILPAILVVLNETRTIVTEIMRGSRPAREESEL